jgi:PP-loop superfamily ATP-utilizing enzyme
MTYEESKLQLTGGAWHEIDIEIDRIQTAMNHENPIYAAKHIISQLHTKLLVAEMQRDEWRKSWQEEHRDNLNQTLNRISKLQVGLNTAETETEQQLTVESR